MKRVTIRDGDTMARLAGGRAEVYDLLLGIFGCLPDQLLISNLEGNGYSSVIEGLSRMDNHKCQQGVSYVRSYLSSLWKRPVEEVLDELSVDRTRLLRGTDYDNLKPPYEGLYSGEVSIGKSIMEIKSFYRKSGLLPDDNVQESPDYLCIELDFMKRLCLREMEEWSSGIDTAESIMTELSFLKDHLGKWISDFCIQAEKNAMTDFYRGFLMILDAVVTLDTEYIIRLSQN